jgi:CubicO group peptidase (beta-lactamase class C family)
MHRPCFSSTGIFVLVVLTLLGRGFAAGGELSAGNSSWSGLEAKLDSLRSEYSVPGLAVALVSKDSVLWTYCVGVSDYSTGLPVTDSTLFRTGSVAKSLVSVAVMRMIEEGLFGLETPLDDLIPEIAIDNPWAATDPVRVVHLLEHSSGMEDLHHWEYFNTRHDPDITTLDYLEMSVNTRKLMWRPGTRMAYSSHGYAVLRYLIEKVSGVTFEEYMNESVLNPLGMSDSRFGLPADERVRLAQGHAGGDEAITWLPKYKRSLYSSVRDMAKFACLFSNRGQIEGRQWLAESTVKRMERPLTTTAARSGLAMGYGLGLRTRFMDGLMYLGHSGNIPGYTSIFAYYPEHGVGYAMLMNTSSTRAFTPLRRQIQKFLLPDASPVEPPSSALSAEHLRQYTGYYHRSNFGLRLMAAGSVLMPSDIRMEIVGDTLWEVNAGGKSYRLIPVAPGLFRRPDQSEATVIFTVDDNGNRIMADPIYFDEYARGSSVLAQGTRFVAVACIGIIFSVVVYALLWLVFKLAGRFRGKSIGITELLARLIPAAAVLILFGAVFLMTLSNPARIMAEGLYGWTTVFLFIATIVFAVLTLINLGLLFLIWRHKVGRICSRVYLTTVATALCIAVGYMAYWGLIGFRAWAY